MKIKVLHCPNIVGGNAPGLARAERDAGLESAAAILHASMNFYNYPVDIILSKGGRAFWKNQYARWKLLFLAMQYDVIHYNFGQTIMPEYQGRNREETSFFHSFAEMVFRPYLFLFQYFDLRVLKMLNKVLIMTFQGDDARQGDYCTKHYKYCAATEVGVDYYNEISDHIKREKIKYLAKYVDYIYALNPDLLNVLPSEASFLPYCHLDLSEWSPVFEGQMHRTGRPLVVHAPTSRLGKGTRFLLAAIDRLKSDGVEFDFELVEGVSNREARKIYERADILVDQLLHGWYGGLAVELMALGKPVVCYIRGKDLMYIPEGMRKEIPLIQATPDSIYDVLKYQLTQGRYELVKLGEKSREFVEKWHDPVKVAQQTKEKYLTLINQRKPSIRK